MRCDRLLGDQPEDPAGTALVHREALVDQSGVVAERLAVAREDRVRSGRGDVTVNHAADNTYVGSQR